MQCPTDPLAGLIERKQLQIGQIRITTDIFGVPFAESGRIGGPFQPLAFGIEAQVVHVDQLLLQGRTHLTELLRIAGIAGQIHQFMRILRQIVEFFGALRLEKAGLRRIEFSRLIHSGPLPEGSLFVAVEGIQRFGMVGLEVP